MAKQQIFEDLNLPEKVAKEIVQYWNVAGEERGIIDSRGFLHTKKGIWRRPMSGDGFKNLKKTLEQNKVNWIIVTDNLISINFSMLHYNLKYVKQLLRNHEIGVADSEKGLRLFKKEVCFGKIWYKEMEWCMKGVTVENLGLEDNEIVSLSPISENPDYAEWANLYFAA